MNTKRDFESREYRRSPQLRAITVIFVIFFTVVCYPLTRSVRYHHFLDGGRYNNRSQH
jgi:hypothetical protein